MLHSAPIIILCCIIAVVALNDFTKKRNRELTFTKGSIIYVLEKNENGWHKGVCKGKVGLFPANIVSVLEYGPSTKAQLDLHSPTQDSNAPVEYTEKGNGIVLHCYTECACIFFPISGGSLWLQQRRGWWANLCHGKHHLCNREDRRPLAFRGVQWEGWVLLRQFCVCAWKGGHCRGRSHGSTWSPTFPLSRPSER